MGSRRGKRRRMVDTERRKIERELKTFEEDVEYLLLAFEKSGLPRNYRGRACKRTLEENFTGMFSALSAAFNGPYQQGLPELLNDQYMDTYDFADHFIAYEHEHGQDMEPRNTIHTIDGQAQDIAVLIARKIRQWDTEDVTDLKQMREDLGKAIVKSLGHMMDQYREVNDVVKPGSIPTAESPHYIDRVGLIAVDKRGRCLMSETVETVKTVQEINMDHWRPLW